MNKILIWGILILIFIFQGNIQAQESAWPNSNEYNFLEYEVNLVYNTEKPIETLRLNSDDDDNDKIANFIINFKYDIKTHNNKIYSVYILKQLKALAENITNIYDNIIINEFINKYEHSDDYNDDEIWNKFIVWVLLEKHFIVENYQSEKSIYLNLKERRLSILDKIAQNNKKYAPIAKYITTIIESSMASDYSKVEYLKQKKSMLQKFITEFENTEFAACASGALIQCTGLLGEIKEAEKIAQNAFKQYKNFYTVNSDFYNDIYKDILMIYYKMNNPDKEKIKFYLSKLNKKAGDYDTVCEFLDEKLTK